MLGGSVYIALIRFVVSLVGVIMLYSILSESRFSTRRTVLYYSCFTVVMTAISCLWYVVDQPLYVRIGPHTMYLGFTIFAFLLSESRSTRMIISAHILCPKKKTEISIAPTIYTVIR